MFRRALILLVSALLLHPSALHAQSPGASLYNEANQAFQGGDYATAVAKYQDLLDKYPTETFINQAKFYLGLSELSGGAPDKALDLFGKLSADPQAPTDLKEGALYYSGQAAFAQALKLSGAPKDAMLKKALDFLTQYLAAYPQGTEREDALFARSQVELAQDAYDPMQKDLAELLASFPTSNSRADYFYASAQGYAEQADNLKADHPDQSAAAAQKAYAAFDEIGKLPSAVVTANDARLARGSLILRLAAKPEDYDAAVATYRQVLGNAQLLPLQQGVVDGLRTQIAQAAQSGDKAGYQRLLDQRQRAQARLEALKTAGDPAIEARLRIAQALLAQKKLDEARVLLRFVKPFATVTEQQEQVSYLTILSYALQGQTAKAEAALQQHRTDFAQDPNTQNLDYLLATELQKQGDAAGAETHYRKNLEDYPDGRFSDQATVALAGILLHSKREADASTLLDAFLKKKPNSPRAAEARFDLGSAYFAQKMTDEAAAQFKLVADDPKAGTFQGQAAVQQGFALLSAQRYDEALPLFAGVVAKFPGTEQAATAQFYSGIAHEGKKENDAALASYAEAGKDPAKAVAPLARARSIRVYAATGKTDEMIAAAKDLAATFPDSPQAAEATLALGQYEEKQKNFDEAAAAYASAAARTASIAAPQAQARLAALWFSAARSLGNYKALSDDEKATWAADVANGEKAVADALAKFPAARETGEALEGAIKVAVQKVDVGLLTADQAAAAFADQAAKAEEPAKGRLDLARIAVLALRGTKTDVPALYTQAETDHPGLLHTPEDLERQGTALLAAKQYPAATQTFTRLQTDFAREPHAQAAAVYGLGATLLAQGKAAQADPLFDTLEKQYPWSDKIWEATLGRGLAAENRKQGEKARAYYQKVIMAPNSPPELKARGMLGFARTLEADGKLVENDQDRNAPNALNNYLKIDALFDSARDVAAEGLWHAGQIEERTSQPDKARKTYQELADKYPESPFAKQAKDRIGALPAAGPAK